MKDLIKKYRDWEYSKSEKFQRALNAANRELERQRKWNEYQEIKNDDSLSVSEKYAAFIVYVEYVKQHHPELYTQIMLDRNKRMIEITVKAESGMGKNTIASHIAKALHDMGADVVVDDSDEIGHQYLHKERLQSVFGRNVTISISTELKQRDGKVND